MICTTRPRSFRNAHDVDVVLAMVGEYRVTGPDRWLGRCPVCGGDELLVMAFLGAEDFRTEADGEVVVYEAGEYRDPSARVWCLDGCDTGRVEREIAHRAWRIAALEHRPDETGSVERFRSLPEPPSSASVGERNSTLFSYACALRNVGLEPEAIYQEIVPVNDRICFPPLPDRDVRVIAFSAGRYPPSLRSLPAPGVVSRMRDALRGRRRRSPLDPD